VRKPVIAIFGTSDESYKHYAASVALAETTAAALASKVVILSGASGTGDRGVKGAAARGAGSSYRIGIDQKGRTNRLSSSKTIFQLSTDLGNGRNFLEACVCDAALCFPGEHGTTSEAVFALYLKRPVVFIGPEWPATFLVGGLKALAGAAVALAGQGNTDAFAMELSKVADALESHPLARVSFLALEERAAKIAAVVLALLGDDRSGTFPTIDSYAEEQRKFVAWLKGVS